ncbi:hypothetical protein [Pseudodesulfovibrio sp. zrk46]|uniref:hypothetical protein n=1 Tax=Pseudodesulfovibrio sp. zrk46 TaxID=2725288 RepID=UPI001448E503|nr:hypothetical protein [Pseudodesulfovibrio sp. zrk46]QJB55464.1 hypothetical protein HFN16_03235 [Pseudodesulfovibrio sp. zrk46]
MNKRLEITLFGTMYVIGAIYLPRQIIKTGVSAFGQRRWHSLVGDIALGEADSKTIREASGVVGHPLKPGYKTKGISLQADGFGIEVFLGGEFSPVEVVEAENRTVKPKELMPKGEPGDILGVYWAQCNNAMFFRWDDVEHLVQEDVTLVYDSLALLMGRKRSFDLVMDVTWQGNAGRWKENGKPPILHSRKHVLHKVT